MKDIFKIDFFIALRTFVAFSAVAGSKDDAVKNNFVISRLKGHPSAYI